MSKHIFKSPDGKYIAKTQMKTIFFNRLTKSEITLNEANEISNKYNWSFDTSKEERDIIIERRKKLAEQSDKKNCLVKFLRNIKICTQILKTKKKDLRNAAS